MSDSCTEENENYPKYNDSKEEDVADGDGKHLSPEWDEV
jgi:hypothetical protein